MNFKKRIVGIVTISFQAAKGFFIIWAVLHVGLIGVKFCMCAECLNMHNILLDGVDELSQKVLNISKAFFTTALIGVVELYIRSLKEIHKEAE